MTKRALAVFIWLAVTSAVPQLAEGQEADRPSHFDLVITGGRVIDGTGNPWFYADVGISDGVIAVVGRLTGADATRRIDARGKVVVPGFIDLHSHSSGALSSEDPRRRAALNLVSQGVTTVVLNPDGFSRRMPIARHRSQLQELNFAPNVVLLVGHNTVRRRVMGDDARRPATPAEVAEMRRLVRQGMEDGALGLSAGLEYPPGIWSTTDELVALAEEVVPFGGIYIAHERSAGDPMWYWPSQYDSAPPTLLDATRETIEIAERTGIRAVTTHIKVRGGRYWGSSGAVIQLIERARARGVEIWADQYPYNSTGSDGRVVLIPPWALGGPPRRGGGEEAERDYATSLRRTLDDPEAATGVRLDIAFEMERRGTAENIVVFEYPDSTYIGKSLAQVAADLGTTPVEVAIKLQLEGFRERPGGARLRGFSISEYDIEAYAARPWVATASDAGASLPGRGSRHPRGYGTFPRKIRWYAMERGVLSIEDAIRSASSLPAQILGLRNRGLVREGFAGDIAVLDLARLRDRATFFEPHQYADGVEYVLVNGQPVVDGGRLTGALPGQVISREASRKSRAEVRK